MANSKVSAAVLAVVAIAILLHSGMVESATGCRGNIALLVLSCQQYVAPNLPPAPPPSAACCQAVKGADVVCLCHKLTPSLETRVNMTRVVHVAKTCRNPIPSGTKCGSYTVPLAA